MKTEGRLIDEFANTFKEWHYFVGGGAIGFVTGILVALYVALKLYRARRRRPVVERVGSR